MAKPLDLRLVLTEDRLIESLDILCLLRAGKAIVGGVGVMEPDGGSWEVASASGRQLPHAPLPLPSVVPLTLDDDIPIGIHMYQETDELVHVLPSPLTQRMAPVRPEVKSSRRGPAAIGHRSHSAR